MVSTPGTSPWSARNFQYPLGLVFPFQDHQGEGCGAAVPTDEIRWLKDIPDRRPRFPHLLQFKGIAKTRDESLQLEAVHHHHREEIRLSFFTSVEKSWGSSILIFLLENVRAVTVGGQFSMSSSDSSSLW